MKTYLFLVLMFIVATQLIGCITTNQTPEARCMKAGLDVNSMDLVETQGTVQKALVKCKKSKLSDDFPVD